MNVEVLKAEPTVRITMRESEAKIIKNILMCFGRKEMGTMWTEAEMAEAASTFERACDHAGVYATK